MEVIPAYREVAAAAMGRTEVEAVQERSAAVRLSYSPALFFDLLLTPILESFAPEPARAAMDSMKQQVIKEAEEAPEGEEAGLCIS